jgi:hypothetical protein
MEAIGYDREFVLVQAHEGTTQGGKVRVAVSHLASWRQIQLNEADGVLTVPVGVRLYSQHRGNHPGHRAVGWLARLGLPARLVAVDGSVKTVAGWPREVWS